MKLSDLLRELEEEDKAASESVDFKLILYKFLSRWYWFLVSIFICLSIAFYYTYMATPEYWISSRLLLKDEKKGSDFSSNAVTQDLIGFNSSTSVENEAEVLRSENLMVKVFEELKITNAYYVRKDRFRWKEIYQNEVPVKVNVEKKAPFYDQENNKITLRIIGGEEYQIEYSNGQKERVKAGQKINNYLGEFTIDRNENYIPEYGVDEFFNSEEIVITFYDPVAAGKYFSYKLNVEIVNKLASVIEIGMLDEHPLKGKQILEKLIEVYNKEAENEKNTIAINTISFIDEQLVGLTQELDSIEKMAETYKLRNSITDISAESQLYLSTTTANRQQLSDITIQIDVLESIERYLREQGSDFEMVPSSLNIQDPTLATLINDFNQLQRERERMLRTTQPNNPIVLNLSEQLSSIKNNILENLRNIKSGLEISRNNLTATSTQTQSRASKVPTIERELLDINRKQSIKQEHYLYLIQKRDEAVLTLAASAASNAKVIEPPTPTDIPVTPKKSLIYAFGLIMGLSIPFGLILLKDMWQEKVLIKSDIEKMTSVKILGEISRNKKNYGPVAISRSKRTLIAEQIRFIRTNLAFNTHGIPNKTILVTSGMSGEGKTFFSINLAISLGLAGKRVVLLEFDLRKPALIDAIKLKSEIGISDYLDQDSKISLGDIIQKKTGFENVSIISCGKIPENPSELMMSERLSDLILYLKSNFDHIIIDSAPVGLVSDAFILSEMVDVSVFMVRYNYTTKAQLKTLEDIRKNKKFKNPMIVLNDAKIEMTYGYGTAYGKNYYQVG
jgi:tyrosine-protein kinase Etk/Wzc